MFTTNQLVYALYYSAVINKKKQFYNVLYFTVSLSPMLYVFSVVITINYA